MRKFVKKSLIGALALAAVTSAQAATITFDGLADGTVINNYYSGVSFSNPLGGNVYARQSSFNETPSNVVSIFQTGIPAFNAFYGAIDIVFSSLQNSVSIAAAAVASLEPLGTPKNKPYLQAFDQYNNLLGTVYFGGALPTTPFGVTAFETLSFAGAGDVIAKVRLSSQQSAGGPSIYALFDDLTYNTVNGGNTGGTGNTPVPEPASVALLGLGLYGLLAARRRKA